MTSLLTKLSRCYLKFGQFFISYVFSIDCLSKLFGFFYENGLHLLTKPKKNMKNKIVIPQHNELLNKRGLIESVFDILTSVCDIEHTRHRKPDNAFVHILAGLVAYQHLDKKPAIFFPSIMSQQPIAA